MTDGCDREGSEKPKTHKDVMNRVHIIVVGTILVVPAISAPNSYLNRLGPKPLNFGAPPRPLEEVMAMLPILYTDLPPKPIASLAQSSNLPEVDPFYHWPVTSVPPIESQVNDFPRLPENWVKSRLGPGLSELTPWEPNSPGREDGTTIQTIQSPNSLSPESLIRFFATPGSQKNSGIIIPVPFVPGAPPTLNSSSAVFRQD
jgi:hypothetical protein